MQELYDSFVDLIGGIGNTDHRFIVALICEARGRSRINLIFDVATIAKLRGVANIDTLTRHAIQLSAGVSVDTGAWKSRILSEVYPEG